MRRYACAALGVAMLALGLPAIAGAPRYRMWRITRTTTRAVPLAATLTFSYDSAPNFFLVFGLHGAGKARALSDVGGFSELGTLYPSAYGVAGQHASLCPSPDCRSVPGPDRTYGLATGQAVRDDFYILVERGKVTVDLTVPHWRVHEIPPTRVQKITAEDTSATGLHALTRVERYTGASAKGGRYGSQAWAFIPCDNAGAGYGYLATTPRSPWQPAPMSCGVRTGGAYATGHNPGPVTWNVEADALGVTDDITRLLVVDYPRS